MSRMNCVRGFFVLLVTIGACGRTCAGRKVRRRKSKFRTADRQFSRLLTDEELAGKRLTRAVAQASFVQPADEAPPVKPFEQWSDQEAGAGRCAGPIGPAAVPSLIQALHSQDPTARLKAIEVLGRMGSDWRHAVPELIKLLDDADPAVRKAAARTLGLIGPAGERGCPGSDAEAVAAERRASVPACSASRFLMNTPSLLLREASA